MAHRTEIMEHKQIADGLFAIRVRCCGEEITDSWHTMAPAVINDPVQLAASVQWKHERVAELHQASQIAATQLHAMVGTSVTHA